ncbi:immunoglobulin superfamily member 1-like [Sceloporus undulatus]|uniref:immunoglobulin superfamily member 1-like n=1 Tax=Sceloporus undulatus TaxID=8520 RepID=UPI001C4C1090|nr:immunoglobulin superfamily member 1-like [Sceloporus undulatus]
MSGQAVIGETITILCTINNGPVNFYLHKNGSQSPSHAIVTNFDKATLSISNISWEHSGNYSCSYVLADKPLVYSQTSDTLQLWVSDKPDYTKENIIHCTIGVLILLLLGYLVALECQSTKMYEIKSQQHPRKESLDESTLPLAPAPASSTEQENTNLSLVNKTTTCL